MAGKRCPNCNQATLFETGVGQDRRCSNCGLEVKVPPNDGKGGKGQKCPICGKQTVFKNRCRNCGAEIKMPK